MAIADLEVREVAVSHDHGLHGHQVDVVGAGDCGIKGDIVGHIRGPNHGSCHIRSVAKDKVRIIPSPLHTHIFGSGLCIKLDPLEV